MERLLAGRGLRLRGKAKERAVTSGLGPSGLMKERDQLAADAE